MRYAAERMQGDRIRRRNCPINTSCLGSFELAVKTPLPKCFSPIQSENLMNINQKLKGSPRRKTRVERLRVVSCFSNYWITQKIEISINTSRYFQLFLVIKPKFVRTARFNEIFVFPHFIFKCGWSQQWKNIVLIFCNGISKSCLVTT